MGKLDNTLQPGFKSTLDIDSYPGTETCHFYLGHKFH